MPRVLIYSYLQWQEFKIQQNQTYFTIINIKFLLLSNHFENYHGILIFTNINILHIYQFHYNNLTPYKIYQIRFQRA